MKQTDDQYKAAARIPIDGGQYLYLYRLRRNRIGIRIAWGKRTGNKFITSTIIVGLRPKAALALAKWIIKHYKEEAT